jgi:hypothetical protein
MKGVFATHIINAMKDMLLPIIKRNKNKVNQSLIEKIHRIIDMNRGKSDFIH